MACSINLQPNHAHFAPVFARCDQARWAEIYLRGLLSDCERTSIEPMVLHLGVPIRPLQHFIGQSTWSIEPILADAIQAAAGAWHQREIAGIDYLDALAFARRMKQILTRTDEIEEIRDLARVMPIEDDAKMRTWFEIAEGLPFWISMLFTREMLGIVPEGYDPLDAFQERMQEHAGVRLGAAERTELRNAVMQQVLLSTVSNNSAHLIIALQWMAAIRKGLSLEMLRTLLALLGLLVRAMAHVGVLLLGGAVLYVLARGLGS